MCEAWTQSELKFGKNGALGEKTRTFGPSKNTKYKGKDLGSRFTGGVRRKFLIIGWNFLVLHHDIEYNCVHTLLAKPALLHLLDFGELYSKTLHQSSNKDSNMCCLFLGYSFDPRLHSRAL